MATLNTTEAKNKVVIDNNFNSRNMPQVKNENESPRKEKGINDKEDVEKRNKVDKEGDAVMVVWKDTEQNKNNNRESGLFGLEVNTAKTEANEEPVSPSPRAGGRDAWSDRGEAEQPSQLSFGVRGTIERRKKVYMGSKSGHLGRYRHSRERNADNSITQMAQMDDENISQAITQAGGCLTLHSKWKSQFDDSEASENETEMKGENLQSPEHKQGESPGGGQGQEPPAVISTARQLELSRSARKLHFIFSTNNFTVVISGSRRTQARARRGRRVTSPARSMTGSQSMSRSANNSTTRRPQPRTRCISRSTSRCRPQPPPRPALQPRPRPSPRPGRSCSWALRLGPASHALSFHHRPRKLESFSHHILDKN